MVHTFKKRKDRHESNVASSMKYVVGLGWSRSKCIRLPGTSTTNLRLSPKAIASFQRGTLERVRTSRPSPISLKEEALGFHIWLVNSIQFSWNIGDKMHRKSSGKKVTHPHTIPTFSGITPEFPWNPV